MSDFRELYRAIIAIDSNAFRRLRGKLYQMVEEIAGTEEQQRGLKERVRSICNQVESDHASDRYRIFESEREARGLPPETTRPGG